MSAIPDDIRQTAAKTVFDLESRIQSGEFYAPHSISFSQTLVATFEKAILAERERCAAVIEKTDFIEQATTLTTKTAIAYWSVRFGELIRSGANPQASSQNFTPAPMNVSLPETDERSGEGANAGGSHVTPGRNAHPQTQAVEPVSSSTEFYIEDAGSGA